MVRALLFVDAMSSDDRMDQLLEACMKEDIVLDLGPECTPADVAIQTRLQAPGDPGKTACGCFMHSAKGASTTSPDVSGGRDAFQN